MDQEKIVMNMKILLRYILTISILLQAAVFISCENKKIADVQFSYRGIIDKEYRFNVGRVIPVTISQSIETDGDISADGNYFFYSSNMDGGNFDIYLRLMGDITTVRLTAHPSKDTSPVFSPDGKRLAFVSFRDDPEGDIFILKLKPEELLKRAASGEEIPPLDSEAVNITIEKNPDTGVIINKKDSSPCWSPDGKLIAFSSISKGESGIWLMDRDGGSQRKISSKDGVYPAFSPDGKKIVYVSYSENIYGDIYSVEITSGRTERLTAGDSIKLYPSYAGGSDKIIYSSIEDDTNGSGGLDLQDRSVIRFHDLKEKLSYPLTKKSDTSFKAKWLPVLNTRDYNGVIIYTDISGENINLNIIPESGIIPKKLNAKLQYQLCETYISEYDDEERYAMALDSVYNFYGKSGDNSSRAYVNRSLKEAVLYYLSEKNRASASFSTDILKKKAAANDLYAAFLIDLIENRRSSAEALIRKMSEDKNNRYFAPFAMEDLGDLTLISGEKNGAVSLYNDLLKKFPEFERATDVQTKVSSAGDDLRKGRLSEAAINILNKGNTNQKISVTSDLINPLEKARLSATEVSEALRNIGTLKNRYTQDKKVMAILTLAAGIIYDNSGKTVNARKELEESIKLSHPNDLTYYIANIRLAEMERRLGRNAEAEKYYSAGINRYSRRFKTENFRDKLLWIISYYEQAGERSSSKGDFASSSQIYDKYINLITLMHNKRLYPEIYTEFAPRAHVLYIDAYTEWKGEEGINELEKSYNVKLPVLRMDFNRAALYGLAYIYTKKAMLIDSQARALITTVSKDRVFENLYLADKQIEWALFLDDTFIEPYLLKSWIYLFIDLQRKEFGDDIESAIGGYFPKRLWEKNIPLLDKALNANNEKLYPENEGNIHINLGNTYFLLVNYPRALNHYKTARKFKKTFGSDIEKALFHFHTGYTLWQNGEVKEAREEISQAYGIYSALAAGSAVKYKNQILALYRYFALFSRYEEKFNEAVNWYKKILKHAEDNKIEIDKARYMQEIAFCYKELGDYDTAKSYIDTADRLLRDYPDDTRKYYLRIKLFGIGPFPVFNMGPDTAVIGDNKIFHPLDTWNKKLLSISMLEDISVKNSNYAGAITYLRKKVSLLEESGTSVAVETRIRSLNNLGYYYFRSGNIKEAEKYFNEAGELASEKNNLQGIFSSMMNLANLYAMMIEEGKNEGHSWISDTEKFLSKIEKYRNSYFDMRFTQEKESLKAAAEAKKSEVTPEQIEKLRRDIEKQTSEIYYSLDISIAMMKFYRAELLYSAASAKGDNPQYNLYAHNRDIYNLYTDALRMFEGAISAADKQGNRELKVKLLVNAAHCYEKIGEHEKAYVALIDARNISEQYRFGWTGINANFAIGAYLADYGKEVESGDSRALAEKYMSAAVSRIEEHPLLYTSRAGKIKKIYSRYSEFLIDTGRGDRAFRLMEKLSRVERITSVNSLNPVFSDEYHRNRYFTYVSEIAKLGEIREKRSALLVSGAAPLSPEVEELNRKEKAQEERLSRLFREIEKEESRIAPYLELSEAGLKTGHDIYSFMETGKGIYSWKFSEGRISSGYLKADSADVVSSLINEGSAKKGILILLNDTSLKLVKKHRASITGNFSFINTIDRAEFFSKGSYPAGDIISSVKGIESPSADVKVATLSEDTRLSDYAVIVDSQDNAKIINSEKLFSEKGIAPHCIIIAGGAENASQLSTMLEAAVYSGTGSVIYSGSSDSKNISSIINALYSGSGDKIPGIIKTGYINALSDRKPADSRKEAASEFTAFNEAVNKSDFDSAAVHLARWRAMSQDEKFRYTGSAWLLNLLKGDYAASIKILDSYNAATPEEGAAILFRRLYTYLHKGDFAEATVLRKKITGMEKYRDLEFIDAIFEAVNGRDSAPESLLKIAKPYNTLVPAERYLVLAAEYIYLFNPEAGSRVIRLTPMKQISLNERMMNFVITGDKPGTGISPRVDRIAGLGAAGRAAADESMKLIKSGDQFDALSVFPPLTVLTGGLVKDNTLSYISSLDLERIAPAAYPPSIIALLQRCYASIPENGTNADKIKILRLMKKVSSDSSVFHVIRESMYRIAVELMISGDYRGAYNEASAADERFSSGDRGYAAMQLLLANLLIRGEDYKKAEEKCSIVKNLSPLKPEEKYLLDLQLSMLELNRLRSLKKATPRDAAEFEKLFTSSLAVLKLNPGILNIHGYREMTVSVFDEYINYKMKTGQHSDAHFYNEMKKLIISSSITGVNLVKSAGTIDITAIQQAMPERCGYINISKVKNDIFIWIVDNKMKKALWIENGYKTLSDLLPKYRLSSLKESDVKKASSDLAEYFQPLEAYFKSRKQVVFSTDSFTEQIPFEIIGKGKMLSEEVKISYIASPLLHSSSKGSYAAPVRFIGKPGQAFQPHVEKVAVRESGFKSKDADSVSGGVAHITGEISYSSPEKGYLLDGKGFVSAIGTPDFLYASIGEFHGAGPVDFILNAKAAGVKAAVVNTSPVSELNRGVFAGEFYRSVNSGSTLIDSFASAVEKTRNDSRYRSPAAWGGFRLYIYNLGYLKE